MQLWLKTESGALVFFMTSMVVLTVIRVHFMFPLCIYTSSLIWFRLHNKEDAAVKSEMSVAS